MTDEWVLRTLTIANRLGMHARAASQLVRKASAYKAEIFVEKDSVRVNAKSIMGLLMLGALQGSRIVISARGVDAPAAVEEIARLVEEERFNES
jgi:phosphocarrier protein